ncbi:putative PRK12775-containing protein [Rhizobium phage vB_RleM_PPF1]|uniref:putative PRK12775-containing protein n=1 Tax=Rhizobium phage vB_RleM_PPF1 TaxID=1498228 RepID=UPI00049AAA3E|nr:putative PRK12775-containing protein [Rhizobium phage vB_RleM_PPF1]AID18366.1 putative PRK12775-containing protein [Rhizobium phage vB_RleM_PPF1]
MTINLEYQVAELFRLKMEEFATWCAENWTVTELQAKADNIFDTKPTGFREGYNEAMQNIRGAVDCFLEDRP